MKRTIQDRLAEVQASYDVLVHEARLDYERTSIELERKRAALVDAEIAARRMASRASDARRPRHRMVGEQAAAPSPAPHLVHPLHDEGGIR